MTAIQRSESIKSKLEKFIPANQRTAAGRVEDFSNKKTKEQQQAFTKRLDVDTKKLTNIAQKDATYTRYLRNILERQIH